MYSIKKKTPPLKEVRTARKDSRTVKRRKVHGLTPIKCISLVQSQL